MRLPDGVTCADGNLAPGCLKVGRLTEVDSTASPTPRHQPVSLVPEELYARGGRSIGLANPGTNPRPADGVLCASPTRSLIVEVNRPNRYSKLRVPCSVPSTFIAAAVVAACFCRECVTGRPSSVIAGTTEFRLNTDHKCSAIESMLLVLLRCESIDGVRSYKNHGQAVFQSNLTSD